MMGRTADTPTDKEPSPWGFWATMGFSLVVLAVFFILSFLTAVGFFAFTAAKNPGLNLSQFANSLSANGFYLSVTTSITAPACIALTVLFARLRGGLGVKDYLGFRKVTGRQLLGWLFLVLVFLSATDLLTHFLNRPVVPSFPVDVYKTARFTVLLCLALIILAPLYEEVLFRGFMFQGIRFSRIGPVGAVGITAFIWSILHWGQYDAYSVVTIFVFGVLCGVARLATGSTYLTIAMHALNNLVGLLEVLLYLRFVLKS
jgi:membrane protease YdiL (CAAX protease family)